MSSGIRSVNELKLGLTRFLKPESPCYDDGTNVRLFPFSYDNGVLDITYSGNDFESIMVDTTGNNPLSETDTAIRLSGSPRLVTSLGNNFKAYIRAWRVDTIDEGSPIELYIPSQVVRVNEADINNVSANSGASYIESTTAPSSDNYISGGSANEYYSTYIFKTPLTFTIVESGVTKYITFRTKLDQE